MPKLYFEICSLFQYNNIIYREIDKITLLMIASESLSTLSSIVITVNKSFSFHCDSDYQIKQSSLAIIIKLKLTDSKSM